MPPKITERPDRPNTDRITPAEAKMQRFNIPGDIVQQSISLLKPEQQKTVRWFANWCRENQPDKTAMAALLKKPGGRGYYSYDSIYHVLTGSRIKQGGNVDPVITAMAAFQKIEDERANQIESGWISTRLGKLIFDRCRRAFLRNRILFIFGDSQIGKSENLKEYQRTHNHGETIFVEVPAGGTIGAFLKELGRRLNISTKIDQTQLRARIIKAFDSRMLLIADEAHRCLLDGRVGGLQVFDFLRELYNKAECGIVISLTNEGRDYLLKGPHSKQLQQIWRRRISPLQLPNVTPTDDLEKFAAAYGLEPAPESPVTVELEHYDDDGQLRKKRHSHIPLALQSTVNSEEGLGVWISILQDASDMAYAMKRKITWGAVIKAYCLAQAEAEMIR